MDEALTTLVLDDEPINLLYLGYMVCGNSLTGLDLNASTEDFCAPPAVPSSALAHTSMFQPFYLIGLCRSLFAPRFSERQRNGTAHVRKRLPATDVCALRLKPAEPVQAHLLGPRRQATSRGRPARPMHSSILSAHCCLERRPCDN
jgi:hypothetical protein